MNEKEIREKWWTRFFKVFHTIWLVFITFIIILLVIESNYYFDSFFTHEVFLAIGGFTLVAYLITEASRRTFVYITTGTKFMSTRTNRFQKFLFIFAGIVFLLGFILIPIDSSRAKAQDRAFKTQQKTKYEKALLEISPLQGNLNQCISPVVEKKLTENIRECNLLKGKVKHDYDFCVSLDSINSPASCLYEHDFQKIDCSEGVQKDIVMENLSRFDLSNSCSLILDRVTEAKKTIEDYEKFYK